ncbi:helix-turn-helix transcriptional regulator [Thiobacillus denitrificans]|uniref:helix-turn-helix transcriptional regulator n=1 Tax=Thiobacillus denitrificans TaxID=36861 RepID=UPI000B32446E|nr:transcriptional regulator [Thiobacillus denitrificans]
MHNDDFQLVRIDEGCKQLCMCRAGYYKAHAEGLTPPPVKVGLRAAAIPKREIDAINAARAAGVNDDGIRALVQRLVADRTKRFAKLTGQLDDATRQAA